MRRVYFLITNLSLIVCRHHNETHHQTFENGREREKERERERSGKGLNNHFVEKFTLLSFKIFKPYIVFFLAQSNTQSFKI